MKARPGAHVSKATDTKMVMAVQGRMLEIEDHFEPQ